MIENHQPHILYGFDVTHMKSDDVHIYITMHETSSKMARKLGYTTELYTNSNIFDGYFDLIHKISDSYIFWDSYKVLPYLLRNDDYMVIDYDVFIYKKIIFDKDVDFYFDTFESWKYYNEPIKILTDLGIGSVIPEWNSNKQKVMNTGILYFRNRDFRKLYYERYISFYNFCKQNIEVLKKYTPFQMFGTIAEQYLLTILSEYYNMRHHNFSKLPRVKNNFYHHNPGKEKFSKTINTSISLL